MDLLLDNESQGSGVYLPELDEPEHCNAQNTALWELHLLQVSEELTNLGNKSQQSIAAKGSCALQKENKGLQAYQSTLAYVSSLHTKMKSSTVV